MVKLSLHNPGLCQTPETPQVHRQVLAVIEVFARCGNTECPDSKGIKTIYSPAFIIFSALLSYTPKAALVPPVVSLTSANTIVKSDFKKKKQTTVAKQTIVQPAAGASSGGSSGSKTTALLKGAIGVRISHTGRL